MKKKTKSLMVINLLFYLNNFVVIILTSIFGLEGLGALWFFSPFIFIFFTTTMIESTNKDILKPVKRIALIDFILRIIFVFINYFTIIEMFNIKTTYIIVINIIFLVANFLIELKMHKLICLYSSRKEKIEDDLLSINEIDDLLDDYYSSKQSILKDKKPEEKEEINNVYKVTSIVGYSYVLIFFLIGGVLFGFEFFGEKYRHVTLFIAFILLVIYFYFTNLKIFLFYKDRSQSKKVELRDNITFLIGLSIIYILQGYVHIGTGTFNFLGILIALTFFLPTISTNKNISSRFHKVNKEYLKN